MYSAYTVKKLPKRKQKKSICLTFGCEFVQFNHKKFQKKEETGKNEQKNHEIVVYRKKEKTINYCIFVDTSSNW
jgi:hypothetical protein